LALVYDFVPLLEAILDVDAVLLHEVLDVSLAGYDLVTGTQVLLDGLGFGGGFDDYESLRHGGLNVPSTP